MDSLSRDRILELFALLNEELSATETVGELYVVGGAVMCLAFKSRDATRDVDALFEPVAAVRAAAARVAARTGVPASWLNDAVKGFLGPDNAFDQDPFLELSHLRVFFPRPEYLLALKAVALRLGPEFHDEEDVRYLLRHLGIEHSSEAIEIIERYIPPAQVPAKTRFALEGILEGRGG